jgi:putative peptide zinc metalloprotease protein
VAIVADVPARPDGLELIGEMVGSGYRTPPSLVRRHDGQTLQLTPLLYAILEAVDGRRGYEDIARLVSERVDRTVSASDVEALVNRQLRPRGLLLAADGSAPTLKRSNPLTGLRLKVAVTDPARTRRITDPFTVLFNWWVWVPILAAFAFITGWLLLERGLASATYQAFAVPSLLLMVIVVTVLSAGFHEFGHAAAARRGGAQPGAMGAGWFLLWPAFYTDVTDTYRLGRAARIRTDLGGLYFNAIVAVAIAAIWWATRWDALLLIIAAQIIQMLRQLAPLVRFDGYHVLADVTGVPDLFSRIGPIVLSLWPTRWNDPRVAGLKWWARAVVTAWVLVVVPALLFLLLALVLAAPRLIGTALESAAREWGRVGLHLGAGQYLDAAGALGAMAVIALPIVAIAVILGRLATSVIGGLWRGTAGRPVRRAAAGALVLALSAGLAFAWWPAPERYAPVRPYEGGTVLDVAAAPLGAAGFRPSASTRMRGGELLTVLPGSRALPTEADPALALVLVPGGSASPGTEEAALPAWVFPFDQPLPPEPGDNQAGVVNTTDGTTSYDVAMAMVWVTDDEPVLNTNEAYAFASCTDCVTVAVAFQVVVIVGSADVVIPQNLSAAVNYECFECITAAIAHQLVVTVESLPGVEEQIALAEIWDEIGEFADAIPTLPLAEVIARLEEYKEQIVSILGVAPAVDPEASPSAPPGEDPDATPSPDASAAATPEPTASPAPAAPDTTPAPTTELTPSPTPTPTPSPAP